ncbi:MAG: 50S ribosomal protein L18 [Ignavibacteria bacterium]
MSYKRNLTSRERIKYGIRKKVIGSPERPRLVVYRSLNNIYVNLIDDVNNKTITTVSSLSKEIKAETNDKTTKISESKLVGKFLAQKALEKNIKKVVFDRNGYLYHGRVKAVADGAREAGLDF